MPEVVPIDDTSRIDALSSVVYDALSKKPQKSDTTKLWSIGGIFGLIKSGVESATNFDQVKLLKDYHICMKAFEAMASGEFEYLSNKNKTLYQDRLSRYGLQNHDQSSLSDIIKNHAIEKYIKEDTARRVGQDINPKKERVFGAGFLHAHDEEYLKKIYLGKDHPLARIKLLTTTTALVLVAMAMQVSKGYLTAYSVAGAGLGAAWSGIKWYQKSLRGAERLKENLANGLISPTTETTTGYTPIHTDLTLKEKVQNRFNALSEFINIDKRLAKSEEIKNIADSFDISLANEQINQYIIDDEVSLSADSKILPVVIEILARFQTGTLYGNDEAYKLGLITNSYKIFQRSLNNYKNGHILVKLIQQKVSLLQKEKEHLNSFISKRVFLDTVVAAVLTGVGIIAARSLFSMLFDKTTAPSSFENFSKKTLPNFQENFPISPDNLTNIPDSINKLGSDMGHEMAKKVETYSLYTPVLTNTKPDLTNLATNSENFSVAALEKAASKLPAQSIDTIPNSFPVQKTPFVLEDSPAADWHAAYGKAKIIESSDMHTSSPGNHERMLFTKNGIGDGYYEIGDSKTLEFSYSNEFEKTVVNIPELKKVIGTEGFTSENIKWRLTIETQDGNLGLVVDKNSTIEGIQVTPNGKLEISSEISAQLKEIDSVYEGSKGTVQLGRVLNKDYAPSAGTTETKFTTLSATGVGVGK